jgi:hypothetical protein
MNDVLVIYNSFYDKTPVATYRYLLEGLTSEGYDVQIIHDQQVLTPTSHKVVINLTPFMNQTIKTENVKIIQFLDDIHAPNGNYQGFENIYNNSDIVLGTEFGTEVEPNTPFWSTHKDKLVWLPHFAYPYPVNLDLEHRRSFLNSGYYLKDVYPFRYYYSMIFKPNQSGHPGYDPSKIPETMLNEHFYNMLSNYAFCATCGSIHKYVVNKYFEIPYCGTILIGEKMDCLKELGFIDGENCLLFTQEELINNGEKRVYSLTPEELTDISNAGAKLIREKHMLSNRICFIKDIVNNLLNGVGK